MLFFTLVDEHVRKFILINLFWLQGRFFLINLIIERLITTFEINNDSLINILKYCKTK